MNQHLIIFVIPAAAAVVALGLLIWGRRGKRINDHPTCRRCGYDLTGHPPDSPRCSECGSELSAKSAICIGQRQRRVGVIVSSLLVLVASVAWLGLGGWKTLRGLSAQQKPTWWLMLDTHSKSQATSDAALDELADRWYGGKLSVKQANALMDRFLELGSWKRPWTSQWPSSVVRWQRAIQHAHALGQLDEQRWQRFWEQIFPLKLVVESKVRRSTAISMNCRDQATWAGPEDTIVDDSDFWLRYMYDVRFHLVRLQVGGVDCGVSAPLGGWQYINNGGYRGGTLYNNVNLSAEAWAKLQNGPQDMSGLVELTIKETNYDPPSEREIVRVRLPATGTLEIVD